MLRLRPSTIILTRDEVHRSLQRRPQFIHSFSASSLSSSVPWSYLNTHHGSRAKGKQRSGAEPSFSAFAATLQGLSLSSPNPAEEPDVGYTSGTEESTPLDGDLDTSEYFLPTPATLANAFDGEDGSERTAATASITAITGAPTPTGSGVGRIRRWISRTPVNTDLIGVGRHANFNWGLQAHDDQSQYGSGGDSEDTEYLADEDDDNSGIISTEAERGMHDPLLPNPGDTFQTVGRRQLDGTAETDDDNDEDEEDNLMMETPGRSRITSPTLGYTLGNSPSSWLSGDTIRREFVDDVFAYINGSSGIQYPYVGNSDGLNTGGTGTSLFPQTEAPRPEVFAIGQAGHPMQRYLTEGTRRNARVYDHDEEIDPEVYSEDSEDEFPAEYIQMLAERKSMMQMEAARRIIR